MSKSIDLLNIQIDEVTPRTYIVNYKDYYDVNAGAIILHNFIICIDTLMYPKQAKMFKDYLEQKFNLPIKYLFITHYHGDHLFGMSAFEKAEIIGSKKLTENMKERKKSGWTKESFDDWKKEEPDLISEIDEIDIILPSIEFENDYVIEDENLKVQIYKSGGHSGCSSIAYFPEEKVLFAGDEIASGFWIFLSDKTGNPDHWIESFEHLLKLDIEYIVPGHGPVVKKEYIAEQLNFMKELRQAVLDAIDANKTPDDVQVPKYVYEPATDWQVSEALKFLFEFYKK